MTIATCVDAGQLRHRIAIKDGEEAADAEGQMVAGTPATVATVWAKKEAVAGGERRNGLQVEATATHRFTIRYRTGIEHTHYIQDSDGDRYEIVRVYDPAGTKTITIIETRSIPT